MNKIALSLLAAVMILTGCVSNKTYKVAVDESEARRAQLENTRQELNKNKEELSASQQEREQLRKEIEAKDKEIASQKAKLEELSSKGMMTSKEIEALRQERERLSALDKGKAEEIAKLTKEREYLSRELERLQLKAGEISAEKEKELAKVKNTYETLVTEMKKEIEKGDIKITQAVDRLSVNLVEKILFDSGKAEIKPDGLKILKRVGDILKGITDKQIRVEGHTDNVRVSAKLRQKYPTNWELSTARANNVVKYLQEKVGIDPKMLSAAGFSEYKPVADNAIAEGRAQNRRIEIALLPLDIDRVLEELKQ